MVEGLVFNEIEALSSKNSEPAHYHTTYMQGCWERHTAADGTKLPERCICRFASWVSTAVQIIEAIGDSIPF